jgi:hypothetical protein
MQFDDGRERPLAARFDETSQQRLVPVADIFNVFYVDLMFHDILLSVHLAQW